MQIAKSLVGSLRGRPLLWGCLLLTVVTLLNNWPMIFFEFAWDDFGYVVRNYPIQDPVSLKSIWWCLTAFAEANWHPVTWLALHLEFQCFGLAPFGYHAVNLALHLANALLLFTWLYRATGATGKSLAVAALFAVHPLHVESVAWVAEIKDVLSTFFLMLTLHAHVSYARRPGLGRYARMLAALILGLAAKPMLVTAPFALLLLDAWPLGRWTGGPPPARPDLPCPRFGARRLIAEKIPLFLCVLGTCVLTFLAQREGGAVAGLQYVSVVFRLANAANSYLLYLWRMLWPWPLSFFYPLASLTYTRALGSGLSLAGLTLALYLVRWRLPFLMVGWLWFLGTLVPVIGLVQVGSQAFADRYTYIPSIGLLVAVIWLADALRRRLGLSLLLPVVLSGALVFTAMLISFSYLRHWENEEKLYSYSLTIDNDNIFGHNNYGNILYSKGNSAGAEEHYRQALRLSPLSPLALNNLAVLMLKINRPAEAVYYLTKAMEAHPRFVGSYDTLASIRIVAGDEAAAEKLLRQALAIDPNNLPSYNMLGELLIRTHRLDEAMALFQQGVAKAYDRDPLKAFLLNNIGVLEIRRNHPDQALAALREAVRLHPKFFIGLLNLARVQLLKQDYPGAEASLRQALALSPKNGLLWTLYAETAWDRKQYARAYGRYRRALAHNPDLPDAREGYAAVLRALGQNDDADIQAAAASELRRWPRPAPKAASTMRAAH